MNLTKLLKNKIFNMSVISRLIGLSAPTVLHQKINLIGNNKLTEKDSINIKKVFSDLLIENKLIDIDALFSVFTCFKSVLSERDILLLIEDYNNKHIDIGLKQLYLEHFSKPKDTQTT